MDDGKSSHRLASHVWTALVVAAAAARVVYGAALFGLSGTTWYETWLGDAMRTAGMLNIAVAVLLVAAYLARRDAIVWVACVVGLFLLALPAARAGLIPTQLLPWVTMLTGGVAFVSAGRRGARLVLATAFILIGIGLWLPFAIAWASLDYYIAGAAALLGYGLVQVRLRGGRLRPSIRRGHAGSS
jgi:hypothetical protein